MLREPSKHSILAFLLLSAPRNGPDHDRQKSWKFTSAVKNGTSLETSINLHHDAAATLHAVLNTANALNAEHSGEDEQGEGELYAVAHSLALPADLDLNGIDASALTELLLHLRLQYLGLRRSLSARINHSDYAQALQPSKLPRLLRNLRADRVTMAGSNGRNQYIGHGNLYALPINITAPMRGRSYRSPEPTMRASKAQRERIGRLNK